jgi:hypothetical protein
MKRVIRNRRVKINRLLKFKFYYFIIIICFLPDLVYSQVATKAQNDSLEVSISPEATLIAEYNNNINLANKEADNYYSDFLFYLSPKFALMKPLKSHRFGINLDGDLRKGISHTPWELNLQTGGLVNLKFNNGIQFDVTENYMQSGFDLGLTDFPGITKRKNNNIQTKLSYTPGSRLNIFGSYVNRWFTYTNESGLYKRLSNIYGAGISYVISEKFKLEGEYYNTQENYNDASVLSKRIFNDVKGKFTFPVASSFGGYASYTYQKQYSSDSTIRNYNDSRYVAGITWKGPAKLFIWLEGGYQDVKFTRPPSPDEENFVGEIGCKIDLSTNFSGKFAIGLDVFTHLTLDAYLSYKLSEKISAYLAATRKTQVYYFTTAPMDNYISSNLILELQFVISEILQLKLGSTYITNDDYLSTTSSGNIYNNLTVFLNPKLVLFEKMNIDLYGSYLLQKSLSDTEASYQYDTWIGRITMDYSIKKWLKAGASYQYATRISSQPVYGYDNYRVSGFVTFLF